ncbi:adenylyl-sulfate kinase [Nocardia alba]|uniref:Adenylyl-sulfate kinase n=1 Tax=Nocardia alba TaxID=225051 RepID=A0A4R1FG87_9NOCA|nr:adenylyl-sulfate kinase [Nocardia alba]TCJ93817.1 adenylylsulfate kinase [Nocardia alba]
MNDGACRPGATVLLTGLPSSGKSTIAAATRHRLAAAGYPVEVLDGDEVRGRLWPELGLAPDDRKQNLARITTLALMLAGHGVLVLVAAIAPYAADRALMRDRHEDAELEFAEVHVATALSTCAQRDVKGLYGRRSRGELTQLTGVDAAYEQPLLPHLRIDTEAESVAESTDHVLELLNRRSLIATPSSRP